MRRLQAGGQGQPRGQPRGHSEGQAKKTIAMMPWRQRSRLEDKNGTNMDGAAFLRWIAEDEILRGLLSSENRRGLSS